VVKETLASIQIYILALTVSVTRDGLLEQQSLRRQTS